MTNRRGFITSLLALPAAATAGLRKRVPFERQRFCFNCQRMTGPSKWLPQGYHQAPWLYPVHLCDDCVKAITHCATCGKALNARTGALRISHASEPMAFNSWSGWYGFDVVAPTTKQWMIFNGATRPAPVDLIVADCTKCTSLRESTEDSYLRRVCYAFSAPPSQLL
jgi:hypothetical protein